MVNNQGLITPYTIHQVVEELATKPLPDDVVRKINKAIMRAYVESPANGTILLTFSESGDARSIPMKYQLQIVAVMKQAGYIYYGRPDTLNVKFAFPATMRYGENNG